MPSTYLSTLGRAIRQEIKKTFVGPEAGIQDSVKVHGAIGNLFGSSRLLHSVPNTCIPNLNVLLEPSVVAAQSSLHLVNRRKNISVVGAISRTFSIPSVSGPSLQVCGYHTDRLLIEPSHLSFSIHLEKTPMAISSSTALLADCSVNNIKSWHGHLLRKTRNADTTYRNICFDSSRKACMKSRNKERPSNNSLFGFFSYHVVNWSGNSCPALGFGMRIFHTSVPAMFSARTASDVSVKNPAREEQVASSADSSEKKNHSRQIIEAKFRIMLSSPSR